MIVSYYTYWNDFKTGFNLIFGKPQVDSCCICEQLKLKILSKRDCQKSCCGWAFGRQEKKTQILFNTKNENHVLSLAFDYTIHMQIISMPKVPVQELFYLRQLTVAVFCIHNIKTKKSTVLILQLKRERF